MSVDVQLVSTIDLACGCDDRYARHTASMLVSVGQNLSSASKLRVFLLHDKSLSRANMQRLRDSLPADVDLNFCEISDALMAGFPCHKFHRSCWHRVLLPDLLPGLDKILYLDSDMIALDDIGPLWETDLAGAPLAAVVNPLYPFSPPRPVTELGLVRLADYLNSGCLLMDLKRLRAEGFSQAILRYARSHPNNLWPEQDAISALFSNRWKRLHPRWNVQSTFFEVAENNLPVSSVQVREALSKPAILHFTGHHKPWHYLCRHPYRHAYFSVSKLTVWPSCELEGRSLYNRLIKPLPMKWQVWLWLKLPERLIKFLDR